MAETKLSLADWLDDLSVRFILNLPLEELASVERICFQIEEAHWFYEDFLRPLDPSLPTMHLRHFCNLIFHHCPLLQDVETATAMRAYDEFLAYKLRVPVRGAILLNEDMTEVVLVRGIKKTARWSFPRGKINKEEDDFACAMREVYEETGFDIHAAGLADNREEVKSIDLSIRDQQMKMFMIRGVPTDTHFAPRTRGEIGDIQWFKLSDLPTNRNKHQQQVQQPGGQNGRQQHQHMKSRAVYNDSMFYVVAPFLNPLKNWIKQQRKLEKARVRANSGYAGPGTDFEDAGTADEGALFSGNETANDDLLSALPVKIRDGHFDGLLAGLRQSSTISPSPVPQEMPAERSPMDPAAAIKRMLSVDGPAPPSAQAPRHAQAQSDALLSILQGGANQNQFAPPQTPLGQLNMMPPQPPSPTHHHHPPRLPMSVNTQEPPPYPFSPIGQQFPEHRFPQQSQMHYGHPAAHVNAMNPALLPAGSRGPPYPQSANPPMIPHPESRPQMPAQRQPGLRSHQAIGFDSQSSMLPSELRAVPPASQLPMPRLNNHSMNLLKAFTEKDDKPPVPRIETTAQRAAEVYNRRKADQRGVTSPVDQLAESLAALTSAKSPTAHRAVPMLSPIHPSLQAEQANRGSAHQDSLLSLFRGPSTSAGPPGHLRLSLGAEPVELSAQPSPGFPPALQGQANKSARQAHATKLSIPTTDLYANVKPGLTSATISGPLNAPNFDKLRQKSRGATPVEANGREISPINSAAGSPSAPFAPRTILQRPKIADAGLLAPKSPPVPVHTVSPKTVLEQPAPRPFQPQILRRPQPTPSPATVPQPQHVHHQQPQVKPSQQRQAMPPPPKPAQAPQQLAHQLFDRRDRTQTQQKSDLLSLFGNAPAAPSKTGLPAPVLPPQQGVQGFASPVSPVPERQQKQMTPAGEARSRISSINSIPLSTTGLGMGDSFSSGISSSGQLLQQLPQDKRPSAQHTPVTPVDRSFLLGYLQNVVKDAQK